MNRLILVFAGVLFLVGAVLGATIGPTLIPGEWTANAATAPESVQRSQNQTNLLIVHVDQLESATPQVMDLWAAFFYQSDPPQLMLMPLPLDSGDSTALPAWPAPTSAIPPQIYLQAVAERYQLQLDGYIAVDNDGLKTFSGWFTTGKPSRKTSGVDAASLMQSLCQTIPTGDGPQLAGRVRWSQVLPDHLRTDLSFEPFMRAWDLLFFSDPVANCDLAAAP